MAAGEVVPWSAVATEVAKVKLTANSSTFTGTEVVILTATPSLVNGQRYDLIAHVRISQSTVGTPPLNETCQMRFREDTVSGTQIQLGQFPIVNNSGNGHTCTLIGEYTAAATGVKTLVLTAQRNAGAGTYTALGSAVAPGIWKISLVPV